MARKKEAAGVTGTDTVIVGLKHPHGIVIEAFVKDKEHQPVMGGGTREVTVFRATGRQFRLNGNRVQVGEVPAWPIVNGYAITYGVPKDVWETWLEQHQDHELVLNNLVMAHKDLASVKDEARDGRDLRNGMEPLQRKDDPRVPKKRDESGKIVDGIQTADEQPRTPELEAA